MCLLDELSEQSLHLQTQVQALLLQENELNQILAAKTVEVEEIETQKSSLQVQLAQLSAQIASAIQQKETLDQDIAATEQLSEQSLHLQTQVQVLLVQENELNQA